MNASAPQPEVRRRLSGFVQRVRGSGGVAGTVRRLIGRIPRLVRLLLVVTLVPISEYMLLVWISERIGFWPTLLFVLTTGIAGTWMVRAQGLATWERMLDCVRKGESLGDAVFDAALLVTAGILLIAPGVMTDVAGFALLVPRFRAWLKRRLAVWLRTRAMTHVQRFQSETVIDIASRPAEEQPRDTTPHGT